MEPTPAEFLDIDFLLQASLPRQSTRLLALSPIFKFSVLGMLMISLLFGAPSPAMQTFQFVLFLLVVGGSFPLTWTMNRAIRREQATILQAEEAVQMHQWSTASLLLQSLLARPMRTNLGRLQALVYYGSVLMRFRRFDDCIALQEYLLRSFSLDESAEHALKLSRAMAILRQDRLVDADRAISELRRAPSASQSAGLVLLELYRDIKTGHATEGIELFNKKKDSLPRQLGHRQADAYALIAFGWDMLSKPDEARQAYATATLLTPMDELVWRYPELESMAKRYSPTPAPVEIRRGAPLQAIA